ncbi:pfs domain-containing protein [Colletotrichum camelliae]|nr:pfs domain-containing protein [Colletotrichum camelliae]
MDQPPITFGNINIGPGATGVVGVNQFVSNNDNPESKLKNCIEAFYMTDPKVDRNELINFKGEITDGTCRWIRDDETYKAWLANECSQLLWISGGPGRGKTMLSIFLTVELKIHFRHNSTKVLFYFCKHGSERHSTAASILRTLLHQIFEKQRDLARHALGRMGTADRARCTLGCPATLWQIFLDVLADPSLGPLVFLLDGLDECKEDSTRWLVRNLKTIFGPSGRALHPTPNTFKIIVVSREIVGLLGFLRLDLESKAHSIASDVHEVIEAKVKTHPAYSSFDKTFWDDVVCTIQQHCDGTFLWAGFVLNEIMEMNRKLEIEQVLLDVPEGLNAIYARLFCKIPPKWRRQVARLLHWVTVATMPLSITQLEEAWNAGRGEEDVKHRNLQDLVDLSGSLLKVRKFEDVPGIATWETLSLIHSSVGDYLLRSSLNDNPVLKEFRLDAKKVHFEIVEKCLNSVNELDLTREEDYRRGEIEKFGNFETTLFNTDLRGVRFQHNYENWISYAVHAWADHARSCGKTARRLLNSNAQFFRDQSEIRDLWWYLFTHPCAMRSPGNINGGVDKDPSLLHVVSALGLTAMIPGLLKRMQHHDKDCVNRMSENGYTPLYYAAFFGREDAVRLLVDNHARVTEGYQSKGSALQAAFQKQHYQIAKILLQRVCNNANRPHLSGHQKLPSPLLQDLLLRASRGDDVRVLKLLYANFMGINPLKRDIFINSVRHASLPVFEFLLKQGFDVGSKDEKTGLPCLHLAAGRSGSDAVGIVEALLKHGAQVNERDHIGLTALHVAIYRRTRTIPSLLAHGADVNASVVDLLPIHLALKNLNFQAAELLLDASKGIADNLSIHQLSFALLTRCVALDIEKHAEFGLSPQVGISDLHDSATQKRLLEKFLRKGADVHFEDCGSMFLDWFCEPLWAYQLDYVQLLMQHGAHCKLGKDTKRLQVLLAQRFRDGVSAHAWDEKMIPLFEERHKLRKNAA